MMEIFQPLRLISAGYEPQTVGIVGDRLDRLQTFEFYHIRQHTRTIIINAWKISVLQINFSKISKFPGENFDSLEVYHIS
jgi:hypothetical protein